MLEQRIAGECLETKHSLLACRVGIDEKSQLCRHWVDHPGATLHVAEEPTQLPVESELLEELSERHQTPHCRERPIRRATVNSHGVSPPNPLACRLQLPTLSPLASDNVSAHLMDARRACLLCLH